MELLVTWYDTRNDAQNNRVTLWADWGLTDNVPDWANMKQMGDHRAVRRRSGYVLGACAAAVLAACGSPTTGGGADAAASDAKTDAVVDALGETGGTDAAGGDSGCPCVVMTCQGPVCLQPDDTIPTGDSCGDTCSNMVQGMIGSCICQHGLSCFCPDAGSDGG